MLLFRTPLKFTERLSQERRMEVKKLLRTTAEKVRDYAVFEPGMRHHLVMDGQPDEYFNSLHYQIVSRAGKLADETLDGYPSFEVPWRRGLSMHLQNKLVPAPDHTSSTIHRVFPIGVSETDALRRIQSTLPPDLKSPYVLTAETEASKDKCGSVAITQRTQQIVIQINFNVDPGVMSQVCRDLRLGYRSVVQELSRTREEMDEKFQSLHKEIDSLKDLVKASKMPFGGP